MLVALNLTVPVFIIYKLDKDRIKEFIGEPTDIEKKLSNKAKDVSFSEAAERIDFWYLSIAMMCAAGIARMVDQNEDALSMGDYSLEQKMD